MRVPRLGSCGRGAAAARPRRVRYSVAFRRDRLTAAHPRPRRRWIPLPPSRSAATSASSASSASPTRSRTSSSSRCRRCSRCCAPSSTCRGRVLGLLVGVFYAASGVTQFVAGFAVDRFGARPVLLGGLALLAGGTMLAALAPGVVLAVSDRRADGRRQRRVPSRPISRSSTPTSRRGASATRTRRTASAATWATRCRRS